MSIPRCLVDVLWAIPRQITWAYSPWPLRFCSKFAYVLPNGPYYLPLTFGFQGHRDQNFEILSNITTYFLFPQPFVGS